MNSISPEQAQSIIDRDARTLHLIKVTTVDELLALPANSYGEAPVELLEQAGMADMDDPITYLDHLDEITEE